jgi:pilus assembly protein Flp/PilA
MRIAPMVRQFVKEEDGIAVTEYGLLIALVAVALVAVVQTFGSSIRNWFGSATSSITTAKPGP